MELHDLYTCGTCKERERSICNDDPRWILDVCFVDVSQDNPYGSIKEADEWVHSFACREYKPRLRYLIPHIIYRVYDEIACFIFRIRRKKNNATV